MKIFNITKLTKREKELITFMRNPCFITSLKFLIHEFISYYKILRNHDGGKVVLKAFYEKYFEIRSFHGLYDFAKKDRKVRKEHPEYWE